MAGGACLKDSRAFTGSGALTGSGAFIGALACRETILTSEEIGFSAGGLD